MTAQPQPTPDDVVQWKLAYEAQLAAVQEKHKQEIADLGLIQKIETCRAWLLNYLNVNNLQNCKTHHGTFHKITKVSLSLIPEGGKDLFLQTIFLAALKRALETIAERGNPDDPPTENDLVAAMQEFVSAPELGLLDARPLKSEVLPWLERHQAGPESLGCKISQYVELGFRKT